MNVTMFAEDARESDRSTAASRRPPTAAAISSNGAKKPSARAIDVLVFIDEHVPMPELHLGPQCCVGFEKQRRTHHKVAEIDSPVVVHGLLV